MATKKASKKVYVFFNCDETKSRASMNIFYNNEVFKDTIASKKKLWEKISKELEAGRIQIDKDNLPKVQEAVFGDNPCDASQYLHYGQVEALLCH